MAASYAVLFKCHFWDSFAQRQLDRLSARVGRGDIYIFIDQTNGIAGEPDHDPALVIRATEADVDALGLARYEHFSQFWFSADYALHLLTRRKPDYDFYVMVEFDLVLNADLDPMIDALEREEVDFVSHPIPEPPIEEFHWLYTAQGVYELSEMRHWLTCIAIFSGRAAHRLFDRRIELSARFRSGELTTWPMCEIAIPTEMNIAGFRMKPLAELGSLQFYQWIPPYDEAALPQLAAGTFVHPVLDAKRFLNNIMRWHPHHPEFFEKESMLWQRFAGAESRQLALPFLFEEERRLGRQEYRGRIIELMHEVGDDAYLAHHGRDGRNVALNKRTWQSSWMGGRPAEPPRGEAVAGVVTGRASFHTDVDARPWWIVDLEHSVAIDEIRVFNRMDVRERADGLTVHISDDLRNWVEVGRHSGPSFGGADGKPLVVKVDASAQFVRVELPRKEYLHLDQVQVIRKLRR